MRRLSSNSKKSCLQNDKEWNTAAVKKGCGKLSHACSSFENHCLINAWRNETIEVCATKRIFNGKSKYNHQIHKL